MAVAVAMPPTQIKFKNTEREREREREREKPAILCMELIFYDIKNIYQLIYPKRLRCYLGSVLYQPDNVLIMPNCHIDGIIKTNFAIGKGKQERNC